MILIWVKYLDNTINKIVIVQTLPSYMGSIHSVDVNGPKVCLSRGPSPTGAWLMPFSRNSKNLDRVIKHRGTSARG